MLTDWRGRPWLWLKHWTLKKQCSFGFGFAALAVLRILQRLEIGLWIVAFDTAAILPLLQLCWIQCNADTIILHVFCFSRCWMFYPHVVWWYDFVGLQVEAFGRNVCLSQLSLEEVFVVGGNDCKEKEVLFDKATFTDEVKEVVSNICSFSHPGGEKKEIWETGAASFKLILKTGLIKHYLCLSAVISS